MQDLLQGSHEFEVEVLTNGMSDAVGDRAQILIVDVDGSPGGGPQMIARVRRNNQHLRTVAFSSHTDKQFVAKILEAGAAAYVLRDCIFEELIKALHAVRSNEQYLSPNVNRKPGRSAV